jgi:hypothetical protein
MRTTLVVLPIVVVAGCGTDAGVEWRLPCAGSQFDEGASVASLIFEYEWDAGGHLIREEATTVAGVPYSILEQEWDGDVLVFADYRGDDALYTRTATVSGGRIATVDFALVDGVAYHEEWTWAGGELDRIDRTYSAGGLPDVIETYADATSGYAFTTCQVDVPTACDRTTVIGAEFRGDPDHWTRYDIDLGDDGALEGRYDRELERHDLVLTYDTYAANLQGELIQSSHLEYEREPDGTALTRTYQRFGTDPTSSVIEYTFECATE